MITWATLNGKMIGTILRSSSWNTEMGVIADQTRSGKMKTRIAHVNKPMRFTITMHMTLDEYRLFDTWFRLNCRKGFYTFAYPKVNDNSGTLVEYRFVPTSSFGIVNTSGDNLEISMEWETA